MIAKIDGQIMTSEVATPADGKSYRLLQLLQKNEKGLAELVTVKDKNLNNVYKDYSKVSLLCSIRNWLMNGKDGLSIYVVDMPTNSKNIAVASAA